jgi:predicted nuclease with TOPRIM domain
MENSDHTKKSSTEKEEVQNDMVKKLIEKKAEIEEKFNIVNEKLERLRAESAQLLQGKKKD